MKYPNTLLALLHFFFTNIFTGDLNFLIIDRQMETADGGTHENQVQANAFSQFAQEQCLQQDIETPTRKNNTRCLSHE